MADFEDACSPTWANVVDGQRNVRDAVRKTIALDTGEKSYRLNDEIATLVVRPRGWHLPERHFEVDGEPVSASLFDFGLCVFHNAREQLDRGTGPYFYLPKLEGHREARLWSRAFVLAEDELGLDRGSIRATVLIETVLAAFEMDEILYELRDHITALNAGRWDYIFSLIKKLHAQGEVLPDRPQVSMTVPFMRAYTELLVQTCHRRGAHAIGGMAAFIPSRRDAAVNEVALGKVKEDKVREASDGLRRHVGRAPRPGPGRARAVRAAEPARTAPRGRRHDRRRAPRPERSGRRGHRRGPSPERPRRRALPRRLAERHGRRSDREPDGGRRDGGDLALAGVAVGARRPLHAGRRPQGDGRGDRRRGCARRRRSSSRSPSPTSSSSSSRSRRTSVCHDDAQHQGRRHRARDRGGDRLRRALARHGAAAGAALRPVRRQPHADPRGAPQARCARAGLVRAEPRRARAHDHARGAAGGVPRARGAREPRHRGRSGTA